MPVGSGRRAPNLQIGRLFQGTWHFQGDIAQPLIFGNALEERDVRTLYAGGLRSYADPNAPSDREAPTFWKGLVAGYRLDEGRGTTVHDFTGHGNDGTLHGGVTWANTPTPASSRPCTSTAKRPRTSKYPIWT